MLHYMSKWAQSQILALSTIFFLNNSALLTTSTSIVAKKNKTKNSTCNLFQADKVQQGPSIR